MADPRVYAENLLFEHFWRKLHEDARNSDLYRRDRTMVPPYAAMQYMFEA